jgi:hypothetical protein
MNKNKKTAFSLRKIRILIKEDQSQEVSPFAPQKNADEFRTDPKDAKTRHHF